MASSADQMIMGLLKTAGLGSTPNSVAQQNIALRGGQLQNQVQAMQIAGAQAAQQRDQQYQQDTQAYFADPRPERLAQLIAKYPDQAEKIQQAHAALDAPAQASRTGILSSIFNAAQNNRPDLIATQIDKVIAAETAQGMDTTEADALKAALAAKDPSAVRQALAFAQAQLALTNPAFAKQMGIDPGANHFSSTSDGLVYDQRTGTTAREAPAKPVKVTQVPIYDDQGHRVGTQLIDESGNPVAGGGGQSSGGAGAGPSAPAPRYTGPQIEAQAVAAIPGLGVSSRMRSRDKQAQLYADYINYRDHGGPWAPLAAPPDHSSHQNAAGEDLGRDFTPPEGMSLTQLRSRLVAQFPGAQVINEGNHVHVGQRPGQPATTGARTGGGYYGPRPSAPSESLSQSAITSMAQQYLAGDKTVMVGLGRGQQGAADIRRLRGEIAKQAADAGMSGRDIAARMADFAGVVSGERAAGTRIAQIELAATEAEKIIPLALKASDAFPRSSFVPFARAQQMVASGTNDPKLRQFVTANQALVNVYSRAVSPTGAPTVSDKEHARELLSTAYDQASYRAVVQQMKREIAAARAAPHDVRGALYGSVGTMGAQSAPSGFRVLRVRPK